MTIHMSKDQIAALPTTDLAAIVRSTNPTGGLAGQYVWAKEELKRREAKRSLTGTEPFKRWWSDAVETVAS